MTALTDTSAARADDGVLQDRLRADGYLFLRGLLPAADVAAVAAAMAGVLRRHGWAPAGDGPLTPAHPVLRYGSPEFRTVYADVQRLEALHALAHHPALLDVTERVLGGPVLNHLQRIARVLWPDADHLTTAPHQDWTHVQGAADTLTAWVPLVDCPPALGGLRVLEGSHHDGLQPLHRHPGAGGVGIDVADDDPRWRSADFRAGDVLLFHSLTVHGGTPNRAGVLRLSADFRYQLRTDPVALPSLRSHNEPYTPPYAELSEGWGDRSLVEVPDGLEVTELLRPEPVERWHELLEPPPSRFAAGVR